ASVPADLRITRKFATRRIGIFVAPDDAMIRRLRMTVAHLKKQMDRRFTRLQRQMNARFSGVNQRFISVDKRFDGVDQRFNGVDQRFNAVDRRFASLERHLESLGHKLDSIANSLEAKDKRHWMAVDEHERRITDLEAAERARSRAPQ